VYITENKIMLFFCPHPECLAITMYKRRLTKVEGKDTKKYCLLSLSHSSTVNPARAHSSIRKSYRTSRH
jgi:hypothetical protein